MILPIPNSRAVRVASFGILTRVKVDVRDAAGTVFLAKYEEELMQPTITTAGGATINGTRITGAASPSSVDWSGELWARADQDTRAVDFSWDKAL